VKNQNADCPCSGSLARQKSSIELGTSGNVTNEEKKSRERRTREEEITSFQPHQADMKKS